MLEQREMVERSLTLESGAALSRPTTYVYSGDRARAVQPGMVISTTWGAYWQVTSKDETPEDVTFMLDALKATDPRTHNGVVTMLFGGTLT